MNLLKKKIENKEKILGTLVSLTDPCLCEIMGNIGYDCVWIDTEHTYMSYKDVLCHLNGARSANIPAVVRLPQDDLTETKRILEMGPDGIIFPMVKSFDEIKRLIETTLYPPFGTRGFGPLRAIGYGKTDAAEYVKEKSFDMVRLLQIEHIDMMDRLKRGISLRSFANEDPLNAYKREGLEMFEEMTASIQEDTVKYLLKIEVDENGDELLVTIDDDDEYERVADIFDDEVFSEIDYD